MSNLFLLTSRVVEPSLSDSSGLTETYSYAPSGNQLSKSIDFGSTGILNRNITATYDPNRNQLTIAEDSDLDGKVDFINTFTYSSPPSSSRNLSDLLQIVPVNDEIRFTAISTDFEFIEGPVSQILDANADGTPEAITTFTYDVNGNLLTDSHDVNADGTADFIISFTYDDNGNRLTKSSDFNTDGKPERITTFTYDANGNLLTESDDFDADGIADSTTTFTYDANGNRLTESTDRDADGIADSTTTFTYDANGNRLTESSSSNLIKTFTYDSDGNLLTRSRNFANSTTLISFETFTYQPIAGQSRSPNAADDSATTTVGTVVTIDALNNDSDPDGDSLAITSVNGRPILPQETVGSTNGSVTLRADGQLNFTPDTGFLGDAVFSYTLSDGNGGEDTAQVQVTVNELVEPGTGSIGDLVFWDQNGNGILDDNESGVRDVRVTLKGAGADGKFSTSDDINRIQNIDSDDGRYRFDGLRAGKYKVSFSNLPMGTTFTRADVGSNDSLDSDADVNTGMTAVIDLVDGQQLNSIDAGIVQQQGIDKTEILGSEWSDVPLLGSDGDDSIVGLGGYDKLLGLDGNDDLIGGRGNDDLLGLNGNDSLNGTDDVALGLSEVDTLSGGDGQDRFILGNNNASFYVGKEWGDFAVIKDFTVGEDVVVLHGSAEQYGLEVDALRGSTNLFVLDSGAQQNRDVIAIFEGNSSLNLASSSFQFIG